MALTQHTKEKLDIAKAGHDPNKAEPNREASLSTDRTRQGQDQRQTTTDAPFISLLLQ
jgi:hypothetical protein